MLQDDSAFMPKEVRMEELKSSDAFSACSQFTNVINEKIR